MRVLWAVGKAAWAFPEGFSFDFLQSPLFIYRTEHKTLFLTNARSSATVWCTHHGKSILVRVLFYFPILERCIWSIINLRFLSPWPAPCRRVPPSTFYLLLSGGSVAKYFTGYWIECLISALALPHSLPGDGKLWDEVVLFRTNYLHIKRNVSYPPTATKALHSTTKGIVYFRICRGVSGKNI